MHWRCWCLLLRRCSRSTTRTGRLSIRCTSSSSSSHRCGGCSTGSDRWGWHCCCLLSWHGLPGRTLRLYNNLLKCFCDGFFLRFRWNISHVVRFQNTTNSFRDDFLGFSSTNGLVFARLHGLNEHAFECFYYVLGRTIVTRSRWCSSR
jgi:hypothetical protein